jgi:(heptosyl)LPS beta-1,4-glucosyltransferase
MPENDHTYSLLLTGRTGIRQSKIMANANMASHHLETLMPIPMPLLSGVVITKNEADRIGRCVQSMRQVCDEVIVLDSGSTDDTVAIASASGARVQHQDWLGFSAQKNAVIALAKHEWVFLLDADEWCEPADLEKIRALIQSEDFETKDVWNCQRQTVFLEKSLRFGGREKEPVERIFRRKARYLPADVHEKLDLSQLKVSASRVVIQHDTARSYQEYQRKLDEYAALYAKQNRHKAKYHFFGKPYLHAAFHFFKYYFLRGGLFDGEQGFKYHWVHARYVWLKYRLLLRE